MGGGYKKVWPSLEGQVSRYWISKNMGEIIENNE